MRRLPAFPTPTQLRCAHRWRVRNTLSAQDDYPADPWPRVRDVECRRCGLRARTSEMLENPVVVHDPSS
jgi:hypothetical protein